MKLTLVRLLILLAVIVLLAKFFEFLSLRYQLEQILPDRGPIERDILDKL